MRPRFPSAVFGLGIALLLSLALTACGGEADSGPRARAGALDLSEWDFAAHGTVALRGEWGFTWGADPTAAFAGHPGDFIVQPGVWNTAAGTFHPPSGQGRAILSLSLSLPAHRPPLALAVPDVNSAYRLHFNGQPVHGVGRPGDDPRSEIPVYQRPVLRIPDGLTRLDLVMEVSNHHHFEGGLGWAMRLGAMADLTAEQQRGHIIPLAALGALAVAILMQLGFWAGGQRDRSFLILAAFAALVAWRTVATGMVYSLFDADLRADWWYLLPSYVTLFIFPGLYLVFLRELFPAEAPRRLVRAIVAVSVLGVLAALLLPPALYTALRDPFHLLVLAMPVIGTGILGLAIWRGRAGAVWMMGGSLVFLATVVNDSLHYQRLVDTTDLSPLGFAAFAVCYSGALALRLFQSERVASRRLAALNRDLEEKVAERTASLDEARQAAEQASRAKSEFLAVMSHEIRTPLHGWVGLTELLAETRLDTRQRQYVDQLRHTAADLGTLLGDVLDMARIEADRLKLERVPFPLPRLIDELSQAGLVAAAAHDLDFSVEVDPDLPASVTGDPAMVRRVIFNFLDNAAKFTERGAIRLEVESPQPGWIRFAVSDTGCGIAPDRQADMFSPFTQMDSSPRRLHGGSGLGLALCRRLAEMAGGSVGMASRPGEGSTFWCELPLPAAASSGLLPPPRELTPPPGTRVLFADDVPLNRMVLRDFLTGAGCVVDEAADGAEAVAKAAHNDYDLIVLDLRMPGMDGFQAAQAIRRREEAEGLPRCPMAALSAGAAAEDRREAHEAGFDVFLGKPIERTDLLSELAALLPARPEADPPPPTPPEGLEHLMPMFVAEMARDAASLEAIKDGDRQALEELAHAVRGKAAMFGEDILFELLTRLEETAPDAPQVEIDELMARVVERAHQLTVYDRGLPMAAP